ncbi:MAG: TetR/AcrR family transcriptional regulator [Nitrososphaerales archaeon]|jgi:AcrR family transcriptional regulator
MDPLAVARCFTPLRRRRRSTQANEARYSYILIKYLINTERIQLPRTEQANRQIREETTEKILAAAREVFARKGNAAKMSDVASEAGISPGLAYHYFPSKDAIFLALVRQSIRPTDELLAIVQRIPGTPRDRLKRIVTSMLERRRKDPEFYRFFYQAANSDSLPTDLREQIERQGLFFREFMRGLIVEGQAKGEIANDDPDKLASALLACVDGLSRVAQLSPEEVEKQMPDAGILLRILGPEPR